MKRQVIENFNEWIFEAAAPKKPAPKAPAAPAVPAGYTKSTLGGTEINLQEALSGVSGWKALPEEDHIQVSDVKYEGTGIASDNADNFTTAKTGILVMSPVVYGNAESKLNFIVGLPYQQSNIQSKDIILSQKYVLFSPFNDTTPSLTQNPQNGAMLAKPTNFRLLSIDKPFMVGLQSLMWILGFNNSEQAKKSLAKVSTTDMVKMLKSGLDSLASVSKIAGGNSVAKVILDGYNAMLNSDKAADIIFNNFAANQIPATAGTKKITVEDIQKGLNLKKAEA